MTSDPNAPSDSKWIDISAFQSAPIGTWGNCGIGVMDAPGFWNADFTLAKRFSMGGQRSLELRVEAFNAFNHPSFGPPARDIAVPSTFGTTRARSARRA